MTQPDEVRIGDAERNAALTALQQHVTAGRLDLDEFSHRSTKAAEARTRAELAALFSDLPEPHGLPSPAPPPHQRRTSGALFGRAGETAVAVAPFVALALFFLAGQNWLWFLLVPAAGAVVYGNRHDRHGRHDRHDRHDRCGHRSDRRGRRR